MNSTFNTAVEANILMGELNEGKGIVGIRFARGERPAGSTFFKSLEAASPTLVTCIQDTTIDGMWVGCHDTLSEDLKVLLVELSRIRPLTVYGNIGYSYSVFDLL